MPILLKKILSPTHFVRSSSQSLRVENAKLWIAQNGMGMGLKEKMSLLILSFHPKRLGISNAIVL